MNKGVIKKICFIALVGIMLFAGKVLATDTRETAHNKIQESTVNSMFYDKTLGYSASYDLRNYNYLSINSPGSTNANWAIVAAKVMELSNKNSIQISAKHIDYSTAYNSVSGGNSNAHNRNLGTAANMRVALGYFTSGRGPVAEGDFAWNGNLNQVSKSTLTSKRVIGRVESYKIFPNMYKMTYDDGKGGKFTYAYNDPIIYNSNQTGSTFSGSKDITSFTGGEIEQVREDIKAHIVKYGAVAAKLYRSGDSYFVYRLGGKLEEVLHEEDYGDGDSYRYWEWERHYTPYEPLSYYCSQKSLTPNHDVIIIGWDDNYQVPGAPAVGAYLVMDPEVFSTSYYTDWREIYRWRHDGDVYESSIDEWMCPHTYNYRTGRYETNTVTVNSNYYYVSYYDYYIESEVYGIKDFSYTQYSNTYQHDILGMSTSIDAEYSSTIAYGANVFNRTTNTPETLNAVSIASESDMQYEIYVNPKDGTLSSDKLIKVAETDVLEAGYNTIKLDKIINLTGKKFAVAVKYISPQNKQIVSMARIGVESPRQKKYKMVSSNKSEVIYTNIPFWNGRATASAGQSFIGTNLDNWTDLNSKSETKNTNICIKAYTTANAGYKIPAEKVEIKNNGALVTDAIQVIKGDSVGLTATVSPSDASSKDVSWTSDNKSIATVDKNGLVTTHAAGKVTITATVTSYPTIKKECIIDVRVPVTSFVLNKSDVTILAGETNVLAAIIGPEDATTTKVEWSSNNKEVVKVTDDGLLIGLKQGNAIVTAVLRDENGVHSATCKVTVPISLVVGATGVTLNKTTMSLTAGTRETLSATVLPADATNTSVVWTSSDKNVAIVNTNGRVTALAPGTSTITVTTVSGGEQATCKVTVTEPQAIGVTGVSLNTKTASLQKDQTLKLNAYVTPSNSTNQNIIWTSSDYDIADVSTTGVVTAINPGTATITATTEDGGYSATATITVIKPVIRVSGIELDKTYVLLEKEGTEQLVASTNPIDADNNRIVWTTSDSNIVTVDETGMITAVDYGEATITATTEDGGYSKKCIVKIPEIVPVTGIQLSQDSKTIIKGLTADFTVNVIPNNATNKNYITEIEDETIAKMDGNGIKALEVGTTTITFTTEDGEKTATCIVTVEEKTEGITIESEEYQISENNEIYDVPTETTAENLKENIETNGTITEIVDKDNNPISDDKNVGTGAQVTITKQENDGTTTETYTIIVKGDLNGDGQVNEEDLTILRKHMIGKLTLEGVIFKAADLNEDYELTIADFSILQQMTSSLNSFYANSNLLGFVIKAEAEQKGVAPGQTVNVYISANDLNLGTNEMRVLKGQLGIENTIFEEVLENDIEALNGWQFEYNNANKTILLYNNEEELTEEPNMLRITLKIKDDINSGRGQVELNSPITSNGSVEVIGSSDTMIIYVEELSSDIYNITEDYKITNILPDTTLAVFKQNVKGSENTTIKDKNGNIISNTALIGTGSTITTASGDVYIAIVKGDTDGDGTIGLTDVSKIKMHYIGLELLEEPYKSAADIDLNGDIGLTDVSKVKMHYLGIETIE